MRLGELLEEGAEYGQLGGERCRVRTTEVIPMRGILSRCYSRPVKGRKTYPFAGHVEVMFIIVIEHVRDGA